MKRWIIILLSGVGVLLIGGLFLYGSNRGSFLGTTSSSSVPGVTESEIVIGSVLPQTGPAAFLGTEYLRREEAYINAVNDAGGIWGRKLRLVSYDDQYDPPKTVYYTQKVIIQDKAFALLNFVGTPDG